MYANETAGAVVVFTNNSSSSNIGILRIISFNFLQYRKNQRIMQIILPLFM